MFAYKNNEKFTPNEWDSATRAEAERTQKELVEAINKN